MLKTSKIIWNAIAPFFTPEEFGDGWEELRPEILIPLFRLRLDLPDAGDSKIIINCGYEDRSGGHGKGLAVDFRIILKYGNFYAACGVVESFLKKYGLEHLVALGIYPEWGDGKRPGFHLEAEEIRRESPRRWGARYKRDTDGALFLRDGKAVQEYIAYESCLKNINGGYRI